MERLLTFADPVAEKDQTFRFDLVRLLETDKVLSDHSLELEHEFLAS